MKRTQVYELVNATVAETVGDSVVLNEDLTNVVDVGKAVIDTGHVDQYVKALINRIGKVVFVDRIYEKSLPSIMMESWEFGSVVQKISMELPTASANESWDLTDGASYDSAIFYQPKITSKFWNVRETFEVDMSICDQQVKESFGSADELTGFVSMIYTNIENAVTVSIDNLCHRAINNMIGETFYKYNSAGTYTGTGDSRCVNLLKLYNDMTGNALTAAKCLSDKDFLRFAAYTIDTVSDRMSKMSTLFNCEGAERFTTKDRQVFVCLSDFERAMRVNLLNANGQLLNDNLSLPTADVIPFWQGSGTDYAFTSISKIDVKTSEGHSVTPTGILACLFDRYAVSVAQLDRRTRSHYSDKAEFTNIFEKVDCGLLNDMAENFVVFYVA